MKTEQAITDYGKIKHSFAPKGWLFMIPLMLTYIVTTAFTQMVSLIIHRISGDVAISDMIQARTTILATKDNV